MKYLGKITDKKDLVTKEYVDGEVSELSEKVGDLETDLEGKVDKVDGKGLSTNDYDDAAKAEVAKIANKQDIISDLDTIRSGASAGATAVQPSAISDMETKTHASETYQPRGDYQPAGDYATETEVKQLSKASNEQIAALSARLKVLEDALLGKTIITT